jgi:hypothetical protein
MKRGLLAAAALAVATLCGTAASAAELLFTYTEADGINFSFEQSATPTPIAYQTDYSTEVAVTELSSNIGSFSDIIWFSAAAAGQFDTDTPNLYVVFGPQVYGGTEADPIFAPGVFSAQDQTDGLAGTLTITAVPEPFGWALMIAGVSGVGLMLRRARRNKEPLFKAA